MNTAIETLFRDDKWEPEPNTGCWLWCASSVTGGYGKTHPWVDGRVTTLLAHRLSYAVHNGPIPDGLVVMHKCDTPACVNPDHLTVGTPSDNSRDMWRKGRAVPMLWRFNDDEEAAIRAEHAAGRSVSALARDHGTTRTTIRGVVRRGGSRLPRAVRADVARGRGARRWP